MKAWHCVLAVSLLSAGACQETSYGEEKELADVIVNSLGMKLKYVPPGEFWMGGSDASWDQWDKAMPEKKLHSPRHRVKLTEGFYIGVTEVTQREWNVVMDRPAWPAEGHYVKRGDDYPATSVDWDDAVEFCKKLSLRERRKYRLPTEAEWEYACRAGTETRFSFGNDTKRLGDYAWFRGSAFLRGEQYAHAVAQKKANPWGLFDMHGNVREWCSDWSGDYSGQQLTDPEGPRGGPGHIVRGGDYVD